MRTLLDHRGLVFALLGMLFGWWARGVFECARLLREVASLRPTGKR